MATDEVMLNQAQAALEQLKLSVALLVSEIERLNGVAEIAADDLDFEVRRLAAVVGVVPAPGRSITLDSVVTLVEHALAELPALQAQVAALAQERDQLRQADGVLEALQGSIQEAGTNLAFALGRQGGTLRELAAEASAKLQSAQDAEQMAVENRRLRAENTAMAVEISTMSQALKTALGPMSAKSPIEIATAAAQMIEDSKDMIRRSL